MSVLFMATQELPDQSANATRIISLAKLFRSCGEEPVLIGTRYHADTVLQGVYEGLEYSHVDASAYESISKVKRAKFLAQIWVKALDDAWMKEHFRMIIVSGFINQSNSFIVRWARKKHISVCYNSVEWYDGNNEVFLGIGGKIKFLFNRYNLMIQHPKIGNIIAISSLLAQYYCKKNCNTIRIPTIVDKNKYHFVAQNDNEKLIVAYAGSPAKKDYIVNAIKALSILSIEERKHIELHLYGVDAKQLMLLGVPENMLRELSGVLFAHGRIPYAEVQGKITAADFTVLLRPNLRYANAGFPTKVGESMMCGTPVIANHTSDLNLYIRDNETGIVAADESAEACVDAFRIALQMDAEEKAAMRLAARTEAETAFNYMSYKEEMQQFIRRIKKL